MQKRKIIVIGASAGGFDALKKLVVDLRLPFDASVFIVWHMAPDVRGILPRILNQKSVVPAIQAVDNEPIKPGQIYVAPPDHHLVLEKNHVRITRGPKENRFRPAIDPLFRSAAYSYGSQVIGIILSGALDDGSAGLWNIKKYGGTTVVQDPSDAEVPSMPENAIRAIRPDYIVPADKIGELIMQLVEEESAPDVVVSTPGERIKSEIDIALEQQGLPKDASELGELSPYTCPECHGVLMAINEGDRLRFRCHTGHAFSADSLLTSLTESIENGLWDSIRRMQECVFLLNHMGDHFAEVNQPKLAAIYFNKAKHTEYRAKLVRDIVESSERFSSDSIRDESKGSNAATHSNK